MKNLRLLLLLSLAILFMYSCRKDNSGPPSANPKVPIKIEDLSVKPTFDWKTSVQYKFTLTSKSNHAVVLVTPSGGVNRKYFLNSSTPFTISLPIPAYEKSVHILFNGKDVELNLNGTNLSYDFNE